MAIRTHSIRFSGRPETVVMSLGQLTVGPGAPAGVDTVADLCARPPRSTRHRQMSGLGLAATT